MEQKFATYQNSREEGNIMTSRQRLGRKDLISKMGVENMSPKEITEVNIPTSDTLDLYLKDSDTPFTLHGEELVHTFAIDIGIYSYNVRDLVGKTCLVNHTDQYLAPISGRNS